MRTASYIAILAYCLLAADPLLAQQNYLGDQGYIHFRSDAPLELIEASSQQLKGALHPEKRTFAFTVDIRSFQGFNSPLQREHFNENYLESKRYPQATFTGRIIEDIDFKQPGEHQVRAKGVLTIHGVARERIINGTLTVGEQGIRITSTFTVLLVEHRISIPRIVFQKIAEQIDVEMRIDMLPQAVK